MSSTELWITLIAGGLITFALRWSFIALSGVVTLPRPVQDALQYVPAAVLAAIIVPQVLIHDEQIRLAPDNFRLLAAIVAGIVAWRTRSILYTMIIGMATLWLLNAAAGLV